eukprot:4209535-Prymnesium_polylepis.1
MVGWQRRLQCERGVFRTSALCEPDRFLCTSLPKPARWSAVSLPTRRDTFADRTRVVAVELERAVACGCAACGVGSRPRLASAGSGGECDA